MERSASSRVHRDLAVRMLRAGKRTKEWQRIRERIKPLFELVGITRCEFRFEGCLGGIFLSFAHVDKRRFLKPGELERPALACQSCHNKLDLMPREKMRATVEKVIAERAMQP